MQVPTKGGGFGANYVLTRVCNVSELEKPQTRVCGRVSKGERKRAPFRAFNLSHIDKETTRYKKYYDKNFRCATLRDGDLVLILVNKFGTDHKIADKWEQDPWEVLSQKEDSPLLTIKNVTTNEIHELHRNVLFPLRQVDPDGPQQDNAQTQIKANSLMVTLFACDCGNGTETV